MSEKEKQQNNMIPRPPVVVIMGHIDHGKTTLLDHIRSSNIAAGESGNITQHIGAYEVNHTVVDSEARKITFLDTPGHELFSHMRERGARVADVAVIVVAGDEGVKPQTIEAIHAAKKTNTPFLVAITKIDKPEADANHVKGQLAEQDVLVEGWGGTVPVVEISAHTGKGVPELLDLILLASELEELTASPRHAGSGVVIESHRDRQRGVVASLLIQDGIVRTGDWIASGGEIGSVRIMEDSAGVVLTEATFSSPVRVLGFSMPPVVGDTFLVCETKKEAQQIAADAVKARTENNTTEQAVTEQAVVEDAPEDQNDRVSVPIIIKADVSGSCEALAEEILRIDGSQVAINILRRDVGDISEDDVKSASGAERAIIVGFKVKVTPSATGLAERYKVTIHTSEVIYELVEWLHAELEKRLPAKTTRTDGGTLKVLKIFKKEGTSVVFGGSVTKGVIRSGSLFDSTRAGEVVGTGKVTNIQQNKMDAKEVAVGLECGLAARVDGQILAGDVIQTYTEEIMPAKLNT